jgi:hypothetical protein
MKERFDPQRYAVIIEKNPREIVMLRGSGCKWRRCRFCDYHLDFSKSEEENFDLNGQVLNHVTGEYHRLEVINSGSFLDLDEKTVQRIEKLCLEKDIRDLHMECHWIHRKEILKYRERFEKKGIKVHIKTGVETFDVEFRETELAKGFGSASPSEIAKYFDDVCLLQCVVGQSIESIQRDIETGLLYFDRVCVNIMVENGMPMKPDYDLIQEFKKQVYPRYIQNERIDILMENTDFGVGGKKNE